MPRPTAHRPAQRLRLALLLALPLLASAPVHAATLDLTRLDALRTDQGVLLNFETRFELPAAVEDALNRGIPLHFAAEAVLMQGRWYWRDKELARISRTWRLAYQPLTLIYKVSQGGLSQNYRSLGEALRALQRLTHWRIADAPAGDDERLHVDFTYRLDTDQLPRPMQIGIGSQPDWSLRTTRTVPVSEQPASGPGARP
ncbi:MAG: hypothetical protein RLZZ592_827 [Pseudomonadota bacterium]